MLWKVVERLLIPKPKGGSLTEVEKKSSFPGMKWLVSPGSNLPTPSGLKIGRESRQRLKEFAKELRSFQRVDMSGMLV